MKRIAILQARTNSQRLPGKVLSQVIGIPLISCMLERVIHSNVDEFWLATTQLDSDDVLVEEASRMGISVYRGDSDNVLSRFTEISQKSKADIVIRLTGDNPLNHWTGINHLITQFDLNSMDYMSDFDTKIFPTGSFPEIIRASELFRAEEFLGRKMTFHHSHVTSWSRKNSLTSRITSTESWPKRPSWRWTVDYEEDLEFVREVFELIGEKWREVGYIELCSLIDKNINLTTRNAHCIQKSEEFG